MVLKLLYSTVIYKLENSLLPQTVAYTLFK
jgi:hypothetical protein